MGGRMEEVGGEDWRERLTKRAGGVGWGRDGRDGRDGELGWLS